MVVQDAVDSNDSSQKTRMWMLREDGKWIDIVLQFAIKEPDRLPVWFDNVAAVMTLLGSLPSKPLVFAKEISAEEREQALKGIEQLNIEEIRRRVKRWKEAKANL